MNSDDNPKPLRRIRTFVHRGRRLSSLKQAQFDRLSERYLLKDCHQPIDFVKIFQRKAPLILEIGFGYGDSLLAFAAANPDIDYLGIEVHEPGVAAVLLKLEEKLLTNVRLCHTDALEVLNKGIEDEYLSGINLFFPDPWPKRRHHKRRFIREDVIELLVRKLKIGGFLHLATDWQDYANQMMDLLSQSSFLINEAGEKNFLSHRKDRAVTKFETRGKKLGYAIWELYFIRKC